MNWPIGALVRATIWLGVRLHELGVCKRSRKAESDNNIALHYSSALVAAGRDDAFSFSL